uniref:Uncharacterized protein LOC103332712 n=1 Tax=Rhizophora mucronata TaxID=61149 RepID=A0A2P2IK56_RHIMU
MASLNAFLLSYLFFFLSFPTFALSDPDCVYTFYIRTGSIFKGGTDSNVRIRLYDAYGYYIEISNIEAWGGLMGPGHNYFERGNLDIFSGRAPCLPEPPCALNLTSDGSGEHSGWYCNYFELTTTGVHGKCSQQYFEVEQWIAWDAAPYELTVIRNNCDRFGSPDDHAAGRVGGGGSGREVEFASIASV